jgi:spermidine synthase
MKFLNLTQAFAMGYIMMALEMVGARSLAPYFGSGIHIWAAVITCMLLSLAIGSIYGGRIADRYKSMRIFGFLNIIAGTYILLMSFIYDKLFDFIQVQMESAIVGAIVSSFILILLPIALMGMFSPFAIRCSLSDVNKSGNISGDIYGVSTIGSVVGTLITTFYFIPSLHVQHVFVMIFVLTFSSGVVFLLLNKFKEKLMALAISGIAVFALSQIIFASTLKQKSLGPALSLSELKDLKQEVLYQKDSGYNLLKVEKMGNMIVLMHRTRAKDRRQSMYNLKDPNTSFGYQELLKTLFLYVPKPQKILVLGAGGGDFTRFAKNIYPKLYTENVDIDPETIKIGKRFFEMKEGEFSKLIVEDARIHIRRTEKRYDIVVIDVFASSTIPHHLVTREFFEEVKSKMSKEACLGMNLHKKYKSFSSIVKTINHVFGNSYRYDTGSNPIKGNSIVIACQKEQFNVASSISKIQNQKLREVLLSNIEKRILKSDYSDAILLSDGFSPINFLNMQSRTK